MSAMASGSISALEAWTFTIVTGYVEWGSWVASESMAEQFLGSILGEPWLDKKMGTRMPSHWVLKKVWLKGFTARQLFKRNMLCQTLRHLAKGIKSAELSSVARPCWLWTSRCQHGLTMQMQIIRFISIKRYDTHLLVDADAMPMQLIEESQEALGGKRVHVHVFANPERGQSKKWSELLDRANITFHPVERVSGTIHPNDAAIIAEAQVLANLQRARRIAVLTKDRDFVHLGHVVKELGKEAIVLTQRALHGTKRFYEDAGFQVLMVGEEPPRSQVQAILNPDGSGKVTFAETEDEHVDMGGMIDEVMEFLIKLDFAANKTWSPVQACAKFWFQHNLGPLMVFPQMLPVKSVRRMLDEKRMLVWNRYMHDSAFLLPITHPGRGGRVSAKTKEKYGSRSAKAVFEGGGPLLLPNSERLVSDVLRKLGYIDNGFNSDPLEAVLVFINSAFNKAYLRKLDAMPADEDVCSTIRSKLHRALMCGSLPGQWMKAPSDASVKEFLVSRKLLDTVHEPKIDVLTAMQAFARKKHLPSMKSYNGCLWQINNFLNPDDPNRRDLLMPKSLLR